MTEPAEPTGPTGPKEPAGTAFAVPSLPRLVKDPTLWKAAVYFPLSGALGLGWFIALCAGVPLAAATTIIWVGLLLWALLLLLLRGGSMLDRRLTKLVFGVEIPSPYRRAPSGDLFQQAKTILGDPATWKDLAFQIVRIPLSFGYFTGSVIGWAFTVSLILSPAVAPFNPEFVPDVFRDGDDVDTVLEAIPLMLIGLVLLPLLVYAVKAASVLHVFLSRVLLGPSEKQALRARATELQASRARGVDAAESERRRIERDLHDGAQQRLLAVAMDIGRARGKLDDDPEGARRLIDQAHTGARAAISELRQLARGIYPAILTDRGLDAALSALAARSPVPVRISVRLRERPPAAVESIAYFTVAEALTNVGKYARASGAEVEVSREQDKVIVEVRDDGVGGAVIQPGGGLAGLADRAATIDGTLTVNSPQGGPTTVRTVLPCSW
ncbi:sensor domain-containing protein [Actinocorallia sp. B10E7]|uniref:sensor histidine kinase n=1 Tax=Actinocorallia sp. B10E7 TaxID=3153558 RepID=UPI00325D1267